MNIFKRHAKEKLANKNIRWTEGYTDKTSFLKKQFEEVVGDGCYFRFEGKDLDSGSEYYCIISPAKIHHPIAKFFAGVRKLPATYSAGGKYFDSITSAANYAHDTWGVPIPKRMKNYTAASLYGISEKVTKWKEEQEEIKEKEERQEEREEEREERKEEREEERENREKEEHRPKVKKSDLENLLFKEAMGWAWWSKRDPIQWWTLDQALKGDKEWQKWLAIDPSLEYVLSDAIAFKNDKGGQMIEYLQIPPNKLNDIFKIYIGYGPAYGAYILSIGPYVGYREEGQNKFGYFTMRKRRSTFEEVQASLKEGTDRYLKELGIQLGPEDFRFVVKQQSRDYDPNRMRQFRKPVVEVIESLDPNDEKAQDFFKRAPMVGVGSLFELNLKGQNKLIDFFGKKDGWKPIYDQAVIEMGKKFGFTPDVAVTETMKNEKFLNKVMYLVRNKYAMMEATGEAKKRGIRPPPKDLQLLTNSGQQTFTALRGNDFQRRQLVLREEVLKLLVKGITRRDLLLNALNENPDRRRKGGIITPKELSKIMEDIEGLKKEKNELGKVVVKNNKQLLAETSGQVEGLLTETGFNDLRTAFDVAALYLSNMPVERATKAKLPGKKGVLTAFYPKKDFKNYSTVDLQQWKGDVSVQEEEEPIEEIERQSVPLVQPEIKPEIKPDLKPKEVKPEVQMKMEKEKEQKNMLEKNKTNSPKTPTNIPTPSSKKPSKILTKELISSTIKNLIKIARDLDNNQKYIAAEEIHKVIRKYQGRLS